MSDLSPKIQLSDSKDCPPCPSRPVHELIKTREAKLGDHLIIRRALPNAQRRMIGAWCFLDHFGPLDMQNNKGMNVAPHPHIGLQTLTWLLAGKILHRDSLGNEQIISPGQVNLMTAGVGIAHSEESIHDDAHIMHGLQLWIALPDHMRKMDPDFAHYTTLPVHKKEGMTITVFAGELFNEQAPTKIYSPLIGLDIHIDQDTNAKIPLDQKFEYGVLVQHGSVTIDNEEIGIGTLMYLGFGRKELTITAAQNTHLVLIGGEPFKEEVLVWWNFVARTKAEITQATKDWQKFKNFGEVKGYQGDRLNAPDVPW